MNLSTSNTVSGFPFPSWNEKLLKIINNSILFAWEAVKTRHSGSLTTYPEEEITAALEWEVQNIMNTGVIAGFNCYRFQQIVRGAKVCDYSGQSIEKEPDLTIRQIDLNPGLLDEPHQNALFIECKIIGDGKTPLMYIKNGIRRFVDGEYGWAMPHSMMIAYVKNQQNFNIDLIGTFNRNKSKDPVNRCIPINTNQVSTNDIYLSKHQRLWQHQAYGAPGNIDITHIWLEC